VNGDCGQGQTCVASVVADVGVCLELNDAGTCARGQSSPPASGVCDSTGAGNVTCGCSYECVNDQCEQACQKDSDCLVSSDICVGTPDQSFCVPGGE
jgi:hypothetical protein